MTDIEPPLHQTLLYPDEVFLVQGAVFEVYRTMGAGFLEAVYQECLSVEFAERDIPFSAFRSLALDYKGRRLKQTYTADFVCFDKILLELKAARDLAPGHRAQTLNYLRATGLRLGLLINFGATPRVKIERFAL
ncbi:MAG TPA: GxxExxY protein [Phenylobacterium sp.]|jgi:GxxExxY protein|uniref:GxxExxY protein n=1 Tax=Phenylobacterium sp. TaxID=1871053 RepID=UPI002CC69E10|nr:GxxExxY protein [Phenylobacterium sp.]HXA41146.1 GxxExxY protein [Phenylobacterium sp.]